MGQSIQTWATWSILEYFAPILNVVYLYYYVMFIIIVGYLAGFRATLNHCEKAALLNLITFEPNVIEKPVTRLGLKTWIAVL